MKRFLIPLIAIALTACANQQELRNRVDAQIYKSNKPAVTVSHCIKAGLDKAFSVAKVVESENSGKFNVSVVANVALGSDTAVTVDIENSAAGSETTYHTQMLFGQAKVTDVIEACQK